MILEVAHLNVKPGLEQDFEAAMHEAQRIIASMPGYLSHEVLRCIEKRSDYLLLVRWQTLADHEVGFRTSAPYQEWRKLLHHFYDPFPTVLHFEGLEGLKNPTA
jgi:heme-degrading monooxygenase HmoA